MTLQRLGSEESIAELEARIERMKKRRGKPLGFSTGFPDLDRPFGGLVPGEVTVLAGRPGMGKTALTLSIARNMTRELATEGLSERFGVFVFSLEMSREALLTREGTADAGISSERFRTGNATDGDYVRFIDAAKALEPEPLYVDDTPAVNFEYMRGQVDDLLIAGIRPVLIVVDHIGITGEKGSSLYESTTRASNAMKRLAKEAKAPVLALAQLNRKVEERNPPVPVLSDLRESGAIEQDADNVCLMYRHDYYFPQGVKGHDPSRKGIAEINVAKARNGNQGAIVRLRFDGSRTRFESV